MAKHKSKNPYKVHSEETNRFRGITNAQNKLTVDKKYIGSLDNLVSHKIGQLDSRAGQTRAFEGPDLLLWAKLESDTKDYSRYSRDDVASNIIFNDGAADFTFGSVIQYGSWGDFNVLYRHPHHIHFRAKFDNVSGVQNYIMTLNNRQSKEVYPKYLYAQEGFQLWTDLVVTGAAAGNGTYKQINLTRFEIDASNYIEYTDNSWKWYVGGILHYQHDDTGFYWPFYANMGDVFNVNWEVAGSGSFPLPIIAMPTEIPTPYEGHFYPTITMAGCGDTNFNGDYEWYGYDFELGEYVWVKDGIYKIPDSDTHEGTGDFQIYESGILKYERDTHQIFSDFNPFENQGWPIGTVPNWRAVGGAITPAPTSLKIASERNDYVVGEHSKIHMERSIYFTRKISDSSPFYSNTNIVALDEIFMQPSSNNYAGSHIDPSKNNYYGDDYMNLLYQFIIRTETEIFDTLTRVNARSHPSDKLYNSPEDDIMVSGEWYDFIFEHTSTAVNTYINNELVSTVAITWPSQSGMDLMFPILFLGETYFTLWKDFDPQSGEQNTPEPTQFFQSRHFEGLLSNFWIKLGAYDPAFDPSDAGDKYSVGGKIYGGGKLISQQYVASGTNIYADTLEDIITPASPPSVVRPVPDIINPQTIIETTCQELWDSLPDLEDLEIAANSDVNIFNNDTGYTDPLDICYDIPCSYYYDQNPENQPEEEWVSDHENDVVKNGLVAGCYPFGWEDIPTDPDIPDTITFTVIGTSQPVDFSGTYPDIQINRNGPRGKQYGCPCKLDAFEWSPSKIIFRSKQNEIPDPYSIDVRIYLRGRFFGGVSEISRSNRYFNASIIDTWSDETSLTCGKEFDIVVRIVPLSQQFIGEYRSSLRVHVNICGVTQIVSLDISHFVGEAQSDGSKTLIPAFSAIGYQKYIPYPDSISEPSELNIPGRVRYRITGPYGPAAGKWSFTGFLEEGIPMAVADKANWTWPIWPGYVYKSRMFKSPGTYSGYGEGQYGYLDFGYQDFSTYPFYGYQNFCLIGSGDQGYPNWKDSGYYRLAALWPLIEDSGDPLELTMTNTQFILDGELPIYGGWDVQA